MVAGVRIPKTLSTRWFSRFNTVVSKRFPRLRGATISITFVSPREMKRLNLLYRGKPSVTDVLSFRYASPGHGARRERYFIGSEFGEIILCLPPLAAQAKASGHSIEREFQMLVIHGVLHIIGHDHERTRDEYVMKRLEKQLLAELTKQKAA